MAESKRQQIDKSVEAEALVTHENRTYLFLKRVTDVFLSLIGIILILPVFILIAIFIKLEDRKSSVFFRQIRVGKGGHTFYMYKFRSMVINAEDLLDGLKDINEASGPLFKIKEDPRVTKVGKFLRKTSLDELPQLVNVLRGDMSLVGPRPALPVEVEKYSMYHKKRLEVKPGLTCYWQVGGRSELGFEEQVDLDIKYINEQSIYLDIVLIFKTIRVLFGSKGAY